MQLHKTFLIFSEFGGRMVPFMRFFQCPEERESAAESDVDGLQMEG